MFKVFLQSLLLLFVYVLAALVFKLFSLPREFSSTFYYVNPRWQEVYGVIE